VEGKQEGEEGCLSIPGFREQVKRGKRVTSARRTPRASFSRRPAKICWRAPFCMRPIILHGKLYISHISALKRDLIRRKVRKLVKAGEWD
jgi:peptide deformylase